MRALLLALAFAGTQSVTWVDCCCGDFCAKQAPCTSGEEEQAPESGCGGESCLHLSPQRDVQVKAAPLPDAPVPVPFILREPPVPAADGPVLPASLDPGALHGPPRHLRFRVLLI
jgi:hypothetical protein